MFRSTPNRENTFYAKLSRDVLKDGEVSNLRVVPIFSDGSENKDAEAHAEVNCLAKAGRITVTKPAEGSTIDDKD